MRLPYRGDLESRPRSLERTVASIPVLGPIAREAAKLPVLRWFIRSLPGRLSLVFMLASVVTLAALLYAGPRLEQALISPRQSAVKQTVRITSVASSSVLTSGQSLETALKVAHTIYGEGPQQLALYRAVPYVTLGSTVTKYKLVPVDGSAKGPASTLATQAARFPGRLFTATVGSPPDQRVEADTAFLAPDGTRVVASAWQTIDDVERTVAIARHRILVAGLGGAAVAMLLAIWVTTRLTRRIRALEAGARKIARGDFTARFPAEGSQELASLGRALDEMQRQLAQLESARRRFIATASHELRTPLSTLQGFLELLEDEQLDEQRRREFVMHASQQAQRLSKLATDLLDLSKLDIGSVQVRRAPTDTALLLDALLAEFRIAAGQAGDTLVRALDDRAATALVDADRVLQVLRALTNNALNHTPAGTTITVGAQRAGARVNFTVADDGPGVLPEVTDDLFEPFVTSDETRGSGLGLAIGRELARRMDGDLTVTSVPGSTVFTLSLPG